MMQPDKSLRTAAPGTWRRFLRKPALMSAAGVIGLGLIGATITPQSGPISFTATALAETAVVPNGNAPMSFSKLAKKVKPAVISIHVKNETKQTRLNREMFKGMPDLPDDHPLNEFFKRFRKDMPEGGSPRQSLAQGSGFIISEDGFAVTNHHVVDDAEEISVTMDDGEQYDATLIGSDSRTDLALIKIKSKNKFKFVEFADTAAEVGDWCLAVGNPFGLGGTVTAGIISARSRDIGSSPYDFLQIDAAVNRGNSGGPAFNLDGEVIGVNTAIVSPSGGNVGIAFAVPAELTQQVIAQLKDTGSVARGWLGVTIQNVSDDIADSIGLDEPAGAMVTKFSEGGPSEDSGMRVGDVILEVDGKKVKDSRDLARKIAGYEPKSKVDVTVLRDGDERDVKVKLGKFPGAKQLAALQSGKPVGEELEDLGLSLAPASTVGGAGENGVVITNVDPQSEAAEKGLKSGDVILEVAGQAVSQPQDVVTNVRKAKDKGRKAVLLRVRSGDQDRFIAIPLKKV